MHERNQEENPQLTPITNTIYPTIVREGFYLSDGLTADLDDQQHPQLKSDTQLMNGQREGEDIPGTRMEVVFTSPLERLKSLLKENLILITEKGNTAGDSEINSYEVVQERLDLLIKNWRKFGGVNADKKIQALILLQENVSPDGYSFVELKCIGNRVGLSSQRMSELYRQAKGVGIPLPEYRESESINQRIIDKNKPNAFAKVLAEEIGLSVKQLQARRTALKKKGEIMSPDSGRQIQADRREKYRKILQWLGDGVRVVHMARMLDQDYKATYNMVSQIKRWQQLGKPIPSEE